MKFENYGTLTVEKLLARLKFSNNRPNSKVKVTGLKMLVLLLVMLVNFEASKLDHIYVGISFF